MPVWGVERPYDPAHEHGFSIMDAPAATATTATMPLLAESIPPDPAQEVQKDEAESVFMAPPDDGEAPLEYEGLLLLDPPPPPEVTVAAGKIATEPGVATILSHAHNTALKIMGFSTDGLEQQQQQQQPATETEDSRRIHTLRSRIRNAIWDDVCHRFMHMMWPERTDFDDFRNEAWRAYKWTPSDQPDRIQMTRMLFSTYFPNCENPPHILGSLDPPTDTLIAQNVLHSTYKKMLENTRNLELYPGGNAPVRPPRAPRAQHKRSSKDVTQSPLVGGHQSSPQTQASAVIVAEPKKPRISVRLPIPPSPKAIVAKTAAVPSAPLAVPPPPPQQPQPSPIPMVVAPPATPEVVMAAPPTSSSSTTHQEESFDKTECELRAAVETSKKEVDGCEQVRASCAAKLEAAEVKVEELKKALVDAQANEQAVEASCVAASANLVMAQKTHSEAMDKLKQYETSKVSCICCKQYTNKPILLSLTCGHICCRGCSEKYLSELLEKAKKEDKPVMCPCCSGAIPDVPQLSAMRKKENAVLVPEAAKGFIDPFVLSGKISENLNREIALQQLAFPEFICAPLQTGERPTRTFCPKCKITPTYGLSNVEHGVVRCTNPDCCVIYCSKCKAHPFHIGKKCLV